MAARGFNRTPHQCRIKVKKLRQRYFWVRDLTQKIGSSVEEKSRFVWYKDLDGILGRRPTSSQQEHEVDIKEEVALTAVTKEPPHRSESSVNCDLDKRGVQSCGELHSEEDESTATSQSPSPQQNDTPWWGAPSTQDRKLKSGSGGLESLLEGYMQHKRQMDEADQKRHEELKTGFENFMRMQQEAEERWFSAIQERQQANSQLFMYMMETFAKALLPQSHTTSGQWMPPMFSYSCTTHNTASPQNFENPVESLASYLLDNMAPHTSSSLLHDLGELGKGAGKGGGGGGSIREAGGAFGKREAAEEERYFRQKEKEQMEMLRKHHKEEIEHHKKEIERLQKEIDRHKGKIRRLTHDD